LKNDISGKPRATTGNITFGAIEAIEDEPVEYIVTLLSNYENAGVLIGGGTYLEDTEVTISATPIDDFIFKN